MINQEEFVIIILKIGIKQDEKKIPSIYQENQIYVLGHNRLGKWGEKELHMAWITYMV